MYFSSFNFYIILFASFHMACANSFLDWFGLGNLVSPISNDEQQSVMKNENLNLREGVTLISVPFEELSDEDKFLQEAQRFSGVSMSSVDTCEHRVVMKIQSSCANMNEEELAKLSIGLLNCQSEVSGRPQVACTEEMSLKECTAPMDSETWNAYHTINNRARAVCYATRQLQFRALSEMTVNKLMSSSLKQLETMDNLEALQKELSQLTYQTFESVKEGHQGLMDQNSGLQLAQRQVQDNIVANLKQLTQEKIIIHSMQHQLKALSEKLSQELDDVESQLESQSEQHQSIHQGIISSLAEISAKTEAIWNTVDERSRKLLKQQNDILKSTVETMENLRQINTTVNYLLELVTQLRSQVDQKMTFITDTIGGDNNVLILVSKHFIYLIAGVLVSLFLQFSLICRLILLVAVVSNVFLVYHQQSLDFLSLTGTIIGLWIFVILAPISRSLLKKYNTHPVQKREISRRKEEEEEDDKLSTKSSSRSGSISSHHSFVDRGDDAFSTDSFPSLKLRRPVSKSGSSSQFICAAVCRNGQLCRSAPVPGLKYCRRHIEH